MTKINNYFSIRTDKRPNTNMELIVTESHIVASLVDSTDSIIIGKKVPILEITFKVHIKKFIDKYTSVYQAKKAKAWLVNNT